MADPLLQIRDLSIAFDTAGGLVQPVRDVSLSIYPGQTVAVVGESGCGKSVTAMSILRLLPTPPARVLSGSIRFQDQDLLTLTERQMQRVRGKEIAMIFQEPMTSLNPVYSIGDQIAEAVQLHQRDANGRGLSGRAAYDIAEQAMRDVGIADPHRRLREYPHEMSGGMRQRVMIAMALSCKPKLLIADEPTTALDVTIQAQILELLRKIQRDTGMAILLITHDLGVVAENADVVNVMYASRMVETATVETLFDSPLHPYTEGLFKSVPTLGARQTRLQTIPGTVPNPANFPVGCKFHTRCHRTRALAETAPADEVATLAPTGERIMRRCVVELPQTTQTSGEPLLREVTPGHWASCHHAEHFAESPVTVPQLQHKREDYIPLATEVQA